MRTEEIDVTELKSIKEVYNLLEENAVEFERNHDIKNVWVKYRDQTQDIDEKQLAQWELEANLFHISGGKPFAYSYSYREELKDVREYPAPEDFQMQAFDYIQERASSAKHPLLLARYNLILWNAPSGSKNFKYAENAIENYIALVNEYLSKSEFDKKGECFYLITVAFETICAIASQSKLKYSEVKLIAHKLLFDAVNFPFYAKHSILKDMLNHKKIFSKEDFHDTLDIIRNEIKRENRKPDSFLFVNHYIPTAILISSKLGQESIEWHNQMGEFFFSMADAESKEDRLWIKQLSLAQALKAFKDAGNKTRTEEIEKLYSDIKKKVKLHKVQHRLDDEVIDLLQAHQDKIRRETKILLTAPHEVIYLFVSNGAFFPRAEYVRKAMSNNSNEMEQFMTTIKFDRNKNIISLPTDKKDEDESFFKMYEQHITHTVLPFLHFIFLPGIESGKLTFRNLIGHLSENTWLGRTFTYSDLGGDVKQYNWISLVAPSIIEYFVQAESAMLSKFQNPNFILCIDSLTLKMEGMIRDFSEKIGIPADGSAKKGIQAKQMYKFLEHPEMLKYFDEDDNLFFKYLFTSEGGLNMRNNVAHSFYHSNNYTSDKMLLLLAALLRIAKYSLEEKSSNND